MATNRDVRLRVGTILMPNEYLRANRTFISGVILEAKDDLWGMSYRIALTNGNVVWKDESTVRDLWDVVEDESR
jgi:hypothetical protein